MNKPIRVITDAASDITQLSMGGRDITVIDMPLTTLDGHEYMASEIDALDMYNEIRNGAVFKTAQVNFLSYQREFEASAQRGEDVLCICLSSGLTSALSAAQLAKKQVMADYPQTRIAIVDSYGATVGYGAPVLACYDLIQAGAGLQEAAEFLLDAVGHMDYIFTLDDLSSLYRGGRLSKAAFAVANTLNIKPLLDVDTLGKLEVIDKVRGTKKARQRAAELVQKRCGRPGGELYCVHTDAEEALNEVIDVLRPLGLFSKISSAMIGPIIGAHTGPGLIGFVFRNPHRVAGACAMKNWEDIAI